MYINAVNIKSQNDYNDVIANHCGVLIQEGNMELQHTRQATNT